MLASARDFGQPWIGKHLKANPCAHSSMHKFMSHKVPKFENEKKKCIAFFPCRQNSYVSDIALNLINLCHSTRYFLAPTKARPVQPELLQ